LFTNILSIVKKNYVEEVETKNLVNGAINGMLSGLDPTVPISLPISTKSCRWIPRTLRRTQTEITVKGEFDGGFSHRRHAGPKPALPSDQIFKIEDEFTKDMTMVDASRKCGSQGHEDHDLDQTGRRRRVDGFYADARHHPRPERTQPHAEGSYGYVRLRSFRSAATVT
jgi:C-terminal processing protease CtpA/Prc